MPGSLNSSVCHQAPTLEYIEVTDETFEERAVFGESGFKFHGSVAGTVGARWFKFDDDVESRFSVPLFEDPPGTVNLAGNRNRTNDDDAIFKFNTSYQFTKAVMGYLTISEGYRQGGVNSGPACEDPLPPGQNVCLLPNEVLIRPDTTVNYEIGLRSTWLDDRLLVNAAVYMIDWDDIQVYGVTVNGGVPITVNGSSGAVRASSFRRSGSSTARSPCRQATRTTMLSSLRIHHYSRRRRDAFDGDRLAGTLSSRPACS